MLEPNVPLVRPFRGLRPAPTVAARIAAPPYDVVSTAEARGFAAGNPYSFFHVSRAEIDLPETTDPYSDAVYARARDNLLRFQRDGVLIRDARPGFYIYRMSVGPRIQTGVALSASIAAYRENRIRKHEFTRPAKETDRVRQIEAVNAITGPVLLVHRADPVLRDLIANAATVVADTSAELAGVRHDVWYVDDDDCVQSIAARFNQMNSLYIADGHHRSAAAARVAAARSAGDRNDGGDTGLSGFLAVSFPHDEVTILGYNRLVRDLPGNDPDRLLAALERDFVSEPVHGAVSPTAPHEIGMYLAGSWYSLRMRAAPTARNPVERLDVHLLDKLVLQPLLGIDDPRTDQRIDFVGGSRGPEALAVRVDSGEMAVGFSLFPTALADLMAVADADLIMPPKSTWFEPKLADGLVSLPLDG